MVQQEKIDALNRHQYNKQRYKMQLKDQLKTNEMMKHDGNMNETEKKLHKSELEAFMMGDSGTKSFIGQPYNGIPSNINNQKLHDDTFSSSGFKSIHNRF